MNFENKLMKEIEYKQENLTHIEKRLSGLEYRKERLERELSSVEKTISTFSQKISQRKYEIEQIEKILDLAVDKSKFRFGYEKVGKKKYKVFNHQTLVGIVVKTSCRWFKGYSLESEFITSGNNLENVSLGIWLAKEKTQCL